MIPLDRRTPTGQGVCSRSGDTILSQKGFFRRQDACSTVGRASSLPKLFWITIAPQEAPSDHLLQNLRCLRLPQAGQEPIEDFQERLGGDPLMTAGNGENLLGRHTVIAGISRLLQAAVLGQASQGQELEEVLDRLFAATDRQSGDGPLAAVAPPQPLQEADGGPHKMTRSMSPMSIPTSSVLVATQMADPAPRNRPSTRRRTSGPRVE